MKIELALHTQEICALTQSAQKRLRRLWNRRVLDPLAFIPFAERKHTTPAEAKRANRSFGAFAGGYLARAIGRLEVAEKDGRSRRRTDKSVLAMIGFGQGHDCKGWFADALRAGFRVVCVDVSTVAAQWAVQALMGQYRELVSSGEIVYPRPLVIQAEIQSALAEPESVRDFSPERVELWYLSRLLGCLDTVAVAVVLREIGRVSLSKEADPAKRKAVVIINALKDDNPQVIAHTSVLQRKDVLLSLLSEGAGRNVQARFVETYRFFSKNVTAMTVTAC